ncbi:MAG: DEAD/DEAH box helicase [Deltaproteobacteria bacterium]|nr:DEAD/DEAH box helicase [Deltaproteobacteria bacterium]
MKLVSDRVQGGVEFHVLGASGAVPPASWALDEAPTLTSGTPARIGVLLRLLEDGTVTARDDHAVFVPHQVIAALDDAELRSVGLPQSAGVTLELRGTGGLSDADFRIERRLHHPDGRPVVAPVRDGCFLRIGSAEHVLPEPLYSLWESVERFNAEAHDLESRLTYWAAIRDRLPEGVQLDDTLDGIQVVLASGFTLNPFRNEDGEPDFDPVVGRWVERPEGDGATTRVFDTPLPSARQEEFARRFRTLRSAKHRYGGGGGVYIILTDRLEKALRVVHETQHGDAGTRRRFLTRPSVFLREALESDAETGGTAADDTLVDDVFFDEGLSERVKGVGIWEPKVLPWLQASGQQWRPDDPAGLLIDNEPVRVPPEKAPELLEAIRRARSEGRDTVDLDGRPIPATEQTERALEALIEEAGRPAGERRQAQPPGPKMVLQIIDNLEDLGFRMPPRGSRGSAERTPQGLRSQLLSHQEKGLHWLQRHWREGSRGALLADDMGLGKTLQALAFLAWVREEMASGVWPQRPILVVAPTGLLRNWRDEHDQHLEAGSVGLLLEAFGQGLRRLRPARGSEGRELTTALPSLDVTILQQSDWVMTTYETLRDYQHSFGRVHWAVVVFDEAQKIKNPAAGLTEAAKAMKQDFTIVMTGTPVENRVEDLWSIVDTARPGELGALKAFSARFRTQDPDERQARLTELREQVTTQTSPAIMLRRLKEDHLDGLPTKEVYRHQLAMPERQATAYAAAVASARQGAIMLEVLQALRRTSLHPAQESDDFASDEDFIAASARLMLAFEILDDVRSRGEKALVFLESLRVQDALAEILQRRYRLPHPVLVINGEVAGAARKGRVDEFQSRPGFDVMLLSPRAGGVGLTLTAANHVIHLARWWNPAVEDQCTDRVYRIGQGRTVHVHTVLAVHPEYGDRSFDIQLANLLDRKRALHGSVLAPPAATESELEDLYRATVEV